MHNSENRKTEKSISTECNMNFISFVNEACPVQLGSQRGHRAQVSRVFKSSLWPGGSVNCEQQGEQGEQCEQGRPYESNLESAINHHKS